MAVGFAVAGGQSQRMGEDKALLKWGASTLLDHTLERLRGACGEVRILSGPQPRYADRGVPVDVDAVAGAGAASGLLTGLAHLHATQAHGPGLFLAVDLPEAPIPLLAHLLALAADFDAVVPISAGGPEPLCAAYGVACLAPLRAHLARGDCKLTCFWPDVRVREVGVRELQAFGDPALMFRNVNTPEEYRSATER
jgi:molybdopterin-guanine dinucleotide biosynthesis protein A